MTTTDLRIDLPAWHLNAACRGKDPDLWFPTQGSGLEARQICATCPVQPDCLEWALQHIRGAGAGPAGIWAGHNGRQLDRIRRGRKQ